MHDIGFPGTFEKQYCLSFPPFSTHDRGTFSTLGEKKVQHRKERSLIAKETRSLLWARRKTFRCSYFLKMIYCSNYALVLFKSSQENEVISTLDFFFPLHCHSNLIIARKSVMERTGAPSRVSSLSLSKSVPG